MAMGGENTMNDTPVFMLPATLDFAAAEHLLETMRHTVQSVSQLRLDASAVEVLTLPCAQVLLATLQSQAEVTIQRPSQAFLDAFADLALDISSFCVAEHIEEDPLPAAAEEVTIQPDLQPAPPMEETSMAKRILTIDDSKTIRDMLRLTLLDAGFEVHQAVDGQDGCDVLEKQKFDVVITDINMPKMDGYGVIRHMRSKAEHKRTPILVLTTESEGSKRNMAREAGATGWMVKPFDPDQLIATINKVAP
jgi:two-component system chemotaxis response regulator CheY